ncbi:photosystem I assembly factor PSA3, chloroplastic-like isoform X2 [Pistacia vera]|uniref:photosystem I assembly factor PSA3, chloroplastic-like isoform X2 n=1 Tax=Pistacia vera TaxID=55513 RepID=UPI001263A1DC|nr:photosystem I assembly factor PSA3, chloroplastic-like isoform X2 [Pistacia vera]
MVVTSLSLTSLSSCNQISSSLHVFRPIQTNPTSNKVANSSSYGALSIKAYHENQNSISGFVNKVIGSLPLIGLVARILSDEGGVGSDTIDFAEFRRRVGNKCGINDSKAFYDFQERRGRRRAKLNAATPSVPMEVRAEKALEAVYVCCFGKKGIEEEDERLLIIMLSAVFPSVKQAEIERIVKDKARKVAEGSDENSFPEPTPIPEEAVKLQMKDLQFLQQNRDT